jgi:hypothetical protein
MDTSVRDYIIQLSNYLLGMPLENVRFLAQIDSQLEHFDGKWEWRLAGKSLAVEKEKPKLYLKSWAERVSKLKLDRTKHYLSTSAWTVNNELFRNINKFTDFRLAMCSPEYARATSRKNVVQLSEESAADLQVLLTVWQNSLDLIIECFLDAVRTNASGKEFGHRYYYWYHQMLVKSYESMNLTCNLTPEHDSDATRDMLRFSMYRLPMVYTDIVYSSDLLKRFTNASYDYPNTNTSFSTLLAPSVLPAACSLLTCFPMGEDNTRVPACFGMEHLQQLHSKIFEPDNKDRAYIGKWIMENKEDEEDDDSGARLYRWGTDGVPRPSCDIRTVNLSAWEAGELYHLIAPRQFLCAQVLVFVLSMNTAMWFFAVTSKAVFKKIDDIRCGLQWLHPNIGMSTTFCNHGSILNQYASSVASLVYGKKTVGEKGERLKRFEWLTTEMLSLFYNPAMVSSRPATNVQDVLMPNEVLHRWDQWNDKEWLSRIQNANTTFDLFYPIYKDVLEDCKPWIEEYFSLPLLHTAFTLANPPLVSDSIQMREIFQMDCPNDKNERYSCWKEKVPSVEEKVRNQTLFWDAISFFNPCDIDSFVDMEMNCLYFPVNKFERL